MRGMLDHVISTAIAVVLPVAFATIVVILIDHGLEATGEAAPTWAKVMFLVVIAMILDLRDRVTKRPDER